MSTKYICDCCKQEKHLEDFYKHKQLYQTETSYTTFTSSFRQLKLPPLKLEGKKFYATIHINDKKSSENSSEIMTKDICKSCAIQILTELIKENMINKL
jgi:hypothetical protein